MNIIRCDLHQSDYLVWKWQPEKGAQSRQNQIRLGSSLRVRTGEVAAFFYSSGTCEHPVDYIEGPADLILQTKNLPVLSSIIGLAYGGDSPFQAELYFINRGQAPQLKWGVPYFDAFDPRFPDLPVPVAAHGTITFHIADIKRFVEVQRLENFDPNRLREQILPQLRTALKANIVTLAVARGIPLIQIGGRVEDLSTALLPTATKVLEGFGVSLRNFVVEGVDLKKDSEGYAGLMQVTRDQAIANVTVQGEVGRISMIQSQEINAKHVDESLSIQREQLGLRQTLQTQSDFLPTHQINLQADVARTAAESLGKIGSGGGGSGGGGMGDIGAAAITLGLGSSVGAAFGQQIVGNIQKTAIAPGGSSTAQCPKCNLPCQPGANFCTGCGSSLRGAAQFPQVCSTVASTPQQIHIAQDNKPLGAISLDEVNRRLAQGSLHGSDLAWYPGLPQWQALSTIPGVVAPPPLPSNLRPPPLPST